MSRKRREPWIDRHANETFYVHYYDEAARRTRRETLATTDRDEARRRFAQWLATGSRSSQSVGTAGVTVKQALDWYYDQHVLKNVVDTGRQQDAIGHLRKFFGSDHLLASVDIAASRAYAASRRSGDIGGGVRRANKVGSDSTIRRELNVLVAAGAHALKWKRITADQLPQVELPAEQRGTAVEWLTKDQINMALAASHGRLHDFILLAYYWAARRKSVEQLTKPQVDLRQGVVDLHTPGAKVTRKRRAKVPIYPEIRPTIARLMAEPGDYLLGSSGSVYRDFTDLMAYLRCPANPHMLRHSRATHMLMDGEDIYKVARLLGDTVQTVERVYGHVHVEYLQTKSNLG